MEAPKHPHGLSSHLVLCFGQEPPLSHETAGASKHRGLQRQSSVLAKRTAETPCGPVLSPTLARAPPVGSSPTLEGCGHSLIVYSSPHIYACQTPNILPPDLDMQTEKAEAQCPTLRTLDPKATTTRTLLCEGLSSEPTASNCRSFGGPAQKRSLVCLPSERWAGEGVVGPSPQYPATTPNHLGAILSFLPVSLRPWRSS